MGRGVVGGVGGEYSDSFDRASWGESGSRSDCLPGVSVGGGARASEDVFPDVGDVGLGREVDYYERGPCWKLCGGLMGALVCFFAMIADVVAVVLENRGYFGEPDEDRQFWMIVAMSPIVLAMMAFWFCCILQCPEGPPPTPRPGRDV